MFLKIVYREDLNKIYFIFTNKNILLEYHNSKAKEIYSTINKIRKNRNLLNSKTNKEVKVIIKDILKIIPESKFFSK